jgi:predicted Holliday junction resolvase-like endonuclease
MILQQEISKYNKDQSDQIRKEMMEMQRKLNEDHEKQMQKLMEQLNLQREEAEKRRERRRKNVYNPRFADKRCWHCQAAGHLIYWCPELDY